MLNAHKFIYMPKTRQQKQEILKSIDRKIKESSSLIVSVFNKLPVSQDQELRADLKQNNIDYQVVKKTLLKKSFEENKIKELPYELLIGNISIAACQDEVTGAKILSKFAKDKEDFKIIGGILEKTWIDAEKILELAKLPSKDELIAKTVATVKAPLNGLVNVLVGNIRGLVRVLNAVKDKKQNTSA